MGQLMDAPCVAPYELISWTTGWTKLSNTTLHFACNKLMHKLNFMIFGTNKLHKATNGMMPIMIMNG